MSWQKLLYASSRNSSKTNHFMWLPTATVAGVRHYVTPHIKGDILFIHGEADDVTLLSDMIQWAKPQRHLVTVLPGANHFFTGYLKQLRIAITRFLWI
jgi:alpha/beta superfamily hydrolase